VRQTSAWSSSGRTLPEVDPDNVAWGLKVLGMKDDIDEQVERALTQAALWDGSKTG
jgi:phosphate transport system ATP-binding protein